LASAYQGFCQPCGELRAERNGAFADVGGKFGDMLVDEASDHRLDRARIDLDAFGARGLHRVAARATSVYGAGCTLADCLNFGVHLRPKPVCKPSFEPSGIVGSKVVIREADHMTAARGEDITMPLVAMWVLINPLKFQLLQKLNSVRTFMFESFFDVHF
jgi:hypothetical protein